MVAARSADRDDRPLREMRSAASEMARTIRERRRHLDEREHEEQRHRALAALTAGVAHDFNNLLTVVLGNIALVKDHPDAGPGIRPLLDVVQLAAEGGASLTRQLLAFARRLPVLPQTTDVNEVVANILQLVQGAVGEPWVVQMDTDPDAWRAHVDRSLLESALLNLALNARDGQPDGGPIVVRTCNRTLTRLDALRLRGDVPPGEYACVCVIDRGVGMPPDVLARAHEPFFTTKAFGKGSGLGLSMVHGFARQSGGFVEITSQVGEGTRVLVALPRAHDVAPRVDAAAAGPAPVAARRGGESVLVVDDNSAILHLATIILQAAGYTVLAAPSARQALAQLARHPEVALLFTDVVMPGDLDGVALAREARSIIPTLPVLFASGHPLHLVGADGPMAAGGRLLQKPYSPDGLIQAVRAVLDASGRDVSGAGPRDR